MKQYLSLFILILFCLPLKSSNYSARFMFQHFPYVDQLPSNSINRLYNDKEGYMWFGTKDGLCRFDGYGVKVFRSSSINPNKLTNNSIQYIAEDDNNKLWIGTLEGINILDKSNYSIKPLENPYIGRDRINSLFKDKAGCMWVATNSNGIVRIFADGRSVRYMNNPAKKNSIPCNNVRSIYQDSRGRIWAMLLNKGIVLFRDKTEDFVTFPALGLLNNPFRMIEDQPDHFLICTWGDGMFAMDLSALPNNPFTSVTILKNGKPTSISNITYSIVKDSYVGYIWVVSFTGLCVLERKDGHTFNLVDSEPMFSEPYYKLFHEIIQDRKGNLWLGSVGDGIFRLDFNKPSLQTNSLSKLKSDIGFSPIVVGFCESADNYIYTVINRLGLYVLNPKTGDITRPAQLSISEIQSVSAIKRINSTHEIWLSKEGKHDIYIISDKVEGSKSLKMISIEGRNMDFAITCFFEDSKGNVWIGTDNGLYQKSIGDKIWLVNPNIINITVIREDKKGNIWVGSDKQGVMKLQMGGGKNNTAIITIFNKTIGNLPSNSIQSICCRKNGEVCIGTRVGSIYFYNEKTNSMQDVSRLYGITQESVLDILEDDLGTLWISTIKKIIRFNPSSHVTTYYTQTDGLLVSSFAKDACIKLHNGVVMFGGNKGFCSFSPNNQNPKQALQQKVVITDIEVRNQSIFENDKDKYFNTEKNCLTLNSNDDNVSLEFSSLNYSATDKIQYAYKLDGIDKEWIYVGNNRRFVNYTNLPAGKYFFQVKASDENGLWSNQITSLKIIKHPPLYQTWWAYMLYLIIISALIYFFYNRIRLRNELKISHIEKEKSEELAQTKLRYFTNISHDLLTPLTIISLLTDEIHEKRPDDKSQLDLIKANVDRLRRLIKQILAFRKIESGNMKLKVRKADVVAFVHEVCYTNFQPLIKEKGINFALESQLDHCPAYFDPDKLDKILYNLLSNAFKFTPPKGSIVVKLTFPSYEESTFLNLSVSDTGSGIEEKDLPHIFTRFYISNSSDQSQSNGIGLSLTRDLVQIHKGEINVESKVGIGTTMKLEIPVSLEAYSIDEIDQNEVIPEMLLQNSQDSDSAKELHTHHRQITSEDYNLLVVEDNRELNSILVNNLRHQYHVLSAETGIQALEVIKEHEIDLVISDVMMPDMDGLTLCKHLKSELATSHIDVLLLTAKSSAEDQVDYYNAGADAYMPKPFELKVLEARVKNIIQKRIKNTESFRKNNEINISSMQYNSLDEEFLKRAVLMVEKNMEDYLFDFDRFADEMHNSKSTLHRKLKSLTGLSPGEFIRNIRLKHACGMLTNTTDPISEIAYAVGFNNPKYFSSSFKSEFEMTPREYRDAHNN